MYIDATLTKFRSNEEMIKGFLYIDNVDVEGKSWKNIFTDISI